jgi:hypothetical protein
MRYLDSPKGTFTDSALDALAEQLTNDGLDCERLPNTVFVKHNLDHFKEYAEDKVYHGGTTRCNAERLNP